jgi:hypothetical protein
MSSVHQPLTVSHRYLTNRVSIHLNNGRSQTSKVSCESRAILWRTGRVAGLSFRTTSCSISRTRATRNSLESFHWGEFDTKNTDAIEIGWRQKPLFIAKSTIVLLFYRSHTLTHHKTTTTQILSLQICSTTESSIHIRDHLFSSGQIVHHRSQLDTGDEGLDRRRRQGLRL